MKYKVGDKVLIDCGDEDDGSLGNGLIGEIISLDGGKSEFDYYVRTPIGITWYYEHELTLQN